MKKDFLLNLTSAALILFASSCDNPKTAGGPGSETTNGITATVFLADGSPAVHAGIMLRKSNFISQDTTGAALAPDFYTDSLGKLQFNGIDSGTYRITIIGDSEIFSQELEIEDSERVDLGKINLSMPGSISGTVMDTRGKAKLAWIGAYGLDILAKTDSNGNYSLNAMPPGILKFFALSSMRDTLIADTGITIISKQQTSWTLTTEAPTKPSMKFQDFEDTTTLRDWYFSKDTVTIIYSPTDYVRNGIIYDSTLQSHVFDGFYYSVVESWVLIGRSISDSNIDLSDLDSITFDARGSGNIRVALERWDANSTNNLKAWTGNLSISNSWKHFSVSPSSFLLPANDTLSTGWESVKGTVNRFHIFAFGGTEIAIDNIWFYGVEF
ncbi:MAG: carboxypeptidase-like regulatory domain-containing protein [Fibrobacteraceae bacterium]|nr:carboxypeptidase-like regulatory domain-containing protein [Fibrobacteraceae bacterium]